MSRARSKTTRKKTQLRVKSKTISKKSPKTTPSKSSKYFHLPNLSKIPRVIRESCQTYEHYRLTDHVLGRGSYGKVVSTCEQDKCDKDVAKIVKFDFSQGSPHYVFNVFYAESIITQFAGEHGFGIPVKAYYLCKEEEEKKVISQSENVVTQEMVTKGVVIMERFDGDLEDIQNQLTFEDFKQLFAKVKIMHSYGILHRDLFLRNVMYKNLNHGQKDFQIIDFGLSIPMGKEIPGQFRAIDYLNLISDVGPELKEQCKNYIYTLIDSKYVQDAELWLSEHYNKCTSEYRLLPLLPIKLIENYGPLLVNLLVWSVRCSPQLDQDIINRSHARVKKVLRGSLVS